MLKVMFTLRTFFSCSNFGMVLKEKEKKYQEIDINKR